jgi:DNA-binding response OmpR family regulator
VEDDGDISNMLRDLLESNGYEAKAAFSGTEALLQTELNRFDLVLLDLMLPGLSGEDVIKRLREKQDLVVIALSAKNDVDTKIELLKLGADDYITKPFDTNELLARMESHLRRYTGSRQRNNGSVLRYKELCLNTDTYEASAGGMPVSLTKQEFLLLSVLAACPRKVFTKKNLYESAWGGEFFGDDNTVNVHISNIRAKLAKADPSADYIQTIWGIGFRMCD